MAKPTLADELEQLRASLKPAFDREQAQWDEQGPAAMARLSAAGVTLNSLGGNCPVQGIGGVDGQCWYFRARGEHWEFRVAATDEAIYGVDEVFAIERDYGEGSFDAGWMPRHEAVGFIIDGVSAFRAAPAPIAMEAGR